MKNNKLISANQLLCALIACRIFVLLNYTPAVFEKASAREFVINALVAVVISIIVWAAIIRLKPKCGSYKASGGIIALVLILQAAGTITDLAGFLDYVYDSGAVDIAIIALAAAISLYGAFLGFEAFSRFSGAMLFALLAALAVMILSALKDINPLGLIADPIGLNWRLVLWQLPSAELAAYVVLHKYVANEKIGKTAVWFTAASLGGGCLLATLCESVLSGFVNRTEYPIYRLAALTNAPLLQRVDVIFIMVWLASGVIRLLLFAIAAGEGIRRCFPKMKKGIIIAISGLAPAILCALAGSLLPSGQIVFPAVGALGAAVAVLGVKRNEK